MAMFHITYTRKKGYVTWEELGCLARALGFPRDTLLNNIPEDKLAEGDGLIFKDFERLCDQKYFHKVLDRSFNHHTDDWNLCVIKKALRLLSHKVLSFSELHNVRMAYQVYEAADTKGMTIDQRTLLRSFKLCNRTIAPLKMMHRIKHMKENLDERNRIQLYEYLDLILWCDLYEKMKLEDPQPVSGKDERDLFKLDDFSVLLSHHDQRLAAYLNKKYIEEEWSFGKEDEESKRRTSKEPPVKTGVRMKQVRYHKRRYTRLRAEVGESERQVTHVQAGYVRDRPVSAPDLSMYSVMEGPTEYAQDVRVETVYSSLGDYMRYRSDKQTRKDPPLDCPRPCLTEFHRLRNPELVTKDDVIGLDNRIESLHFEMETMEEKYHQMVEEDLELMKPGFKERLAKRPKPASPSPRPVPKPKPEPRPTAEFIKSISSHQPKLPLPSHAKACDARFRGWYEVPRRHGHHFVLAAPSFADTYHGKTFRTLRENAERELNRPFNEYIHRFTSKSKVVKDGRPKTAPEFRSSHVTPRADDRRFLKNPVGGATEETAGKRKPRVSTISQWTESIAGDSKTEHFGRFRFDTDKMKGLGENGCDVISVTSQERNISSGSGGNTSPQDSGNKTVYKTRSDGEILEKIVSKVVENGKVDRLEIFSPNSENSNSKIVEMGNVGRVTLLENIIESSEAEQATEIPEQKAELSTKKTKTKKCPTEGSIKGDGEKAAFYIRRASHSIQRDAPKKYRPSKLKKKKKKKKVNKENKIEEIEQCTLSLETEDSREESFPCSEKSGNEENSISAKERAEQIILEVEHFEPKMTEKPVISADSLDRLIKRIEGKYVSGHDRKPNERFSSSQVRTVSCA